MSLIKIVLFLKEIIVSYGKINCPDHLDYLQIIAASVALGFIEAYQIQAFMDIAFPVIRFHDCAIDYTIIEFFRGTPSYSWRMIDEWTGVLVSVMIIGGVILIREIFLFTQTCRN